MIVREDKDFDPCGEEVEELILKPDEN